MGINRLFRDKPTTRLPITTPSNVLATDATEQPSLLDGKRPQELEVTKRPQRLDPPPASRLSSFITYAAGELPYRERGAAETGDIRLALMRAVDHFVLTDRDGKRYDWKKFADRAEIIVTSIIIEQSNYVIGSIQEWEATDPASRPIAAGALLSQASAKIKETLRDARENGRDRTVVELPGSDTTAS